MSRESLGSGGAIKTGESRRSSQAGDARGSTALIRLTISGLRIVSMTLFTVKGGGYFDNSLAGLGANGASVGMGY